MWIQKFFFFEMRLPSNHMGCERIFSKSLHMIIREKLAENHYCCRSQIFPLESVFLKKSRNGLQALRERSGAGDGVSAGRGTTHKDDSLEAGRFSKRNPGSEGSEAVLGTVWRGAGRHTKTKTFFSKGLEAGRFSKRNPGSEGSGAVLGIYGVAWGGAPHKNKNIFL